MILNSAEMIEILRWQSRTALEILHSPSVFCLYVCCVHIFECVTLTDCPINYSLNNQIAYIQRFLQK